MWSSRKFTSIQKFVQGLEFAVQKQALKNPPLIAILKKKKVLKPQLKKKPGLVPNC